MRADERRARELLRIVPRSDALGMTIGELAGRLGVGYQTAGNAIRYGRNNGILPWICDTAGWSYRYRWPQSEKEWEAWDLWLSKRGLTEATTRLRVTETLNYSTPTAEARQRRIQRLVSVQRQLTNSQAG